MSAYNIFATTCVVVTMSVFLFALGLWGTDVQFRLHRPRKKSTDPVVDENKGKVRVEVKYISVKDQVKQESEGRSSYYQQSLYKATLLVDRTPFWTWSVSEWGQLKSEPYDRYPRDSPYTWITLDFGRATSRDQAIEKANEAIAKRREEIDELARNTPSIYTVDL